MWNGDDMPALSTRSWGDEVVWQSTKCVNAAQVERGRGLVKELADELAEALARHEIGAEYAVAEPREFGDLCPAQARRGEVSPLRWRQWVNVAREQ